MALTFDDGPDERGTADVLDVLERIGASATFFVIGPRAEALPELMRRAVDDGHTIGLHCDAHVRHSDRTRDALRADTEDALARLRQLGIRPRLWRTPWGDTAPWTAELADEHDLELVGWDVDTHDWRGDTSAEMFADTVAQLDAGAVVLAHDGIGPGARRSDARQTAAYVERIGAWARDRGLALEALR